MRSKTVRVRPMRFKGHPGVLLQTPFDKQFVRTLKNMIPFNCRWFNEHREGWWISEAYADVATHLAHECFGGTEITDQDGEKTVITAAGERCRQEDLF